MSHVDRVWRIVSRINIGVALGLVCWMMGTGWQVATRASLPAQRAGVQDAWMSGAGDGQPAAMQLVPMRAATAARSLCPQAPPTPGQTDAALTGADL